MPPQQQGPARRTLTEQEFTLIRDRVLANLPKGMDEASFNRLAPTMLEQAIGEAEYSPEPITGSSVGRFISSAAEMLNPVAAATGLYQAFRHPIDTLTNIAAGSLDQGRKGVEAVKQGEYLEAAGRFGAMAPLVGPVAAQVGEQIGKGDIAGGLGATAGLLTPVSALPGARAVGRAVGSGVRNTVATALESGAARRVSDVMTPKVGANKTRFAGMAEDVAPQLLERGDVGGLSREALAHTVGARLTEATRMLDEAADARLEGRAFETQPIIDDLTKRRAQLVAEPVDASRIIPSVTSGVAKAVLPNPTRAYALRWMADEMNSFPFVKKTFNEKPKSSGFDIVAGAGGSPIYQQIVGSGMSATRAQVSKAIEDVLAGNTSGKLRQAVAEVADELAQASEAKAQKMGMRTSGPAVNQADFETRWTDLEGKPDPKLVKEGRPIGKEVMPGPNADEVGMIDKAIAEIKDLGPVARYTALKTIRQAYDGPAKIKYVPSLTQDFLKKSGESKGAWKVTGTLRDHLSKFDPQTAAANAEYHLYKTADDVLEATREVEKARPGFGRRIASQMVGATVGARAARETPLLGAGIGVLLAPMIESLVNSGATTKLQTAKTLQRLATAIRKGDEGHARALMQELKVVDRSAAKRLGAQSGVLVEEQPEISMTLRSLGAER